MTVLGTCIYLRTGKFRGKSNIGENINNPSIHLPYELVFLIKTFNTGEKLNRIFKEMKIEPRHVISNNVEFLQV